MPLPKFKLAILSCSLFVGTTAFAGDPGTDLAPAPVVTTGWHWQLTSYGWLTWLDGNATIRNRGFDVDVSPRNVLEALDFAVMGTVEGRNHRWSLWADLVYADVSGSKELFTVRPNASLNGNASSSLRMTTIEAAAALEVAAHEVDLLWSPGFLHADLYAGARYWNQRASVALDIAGTANIDGLEIAGSRAIARSGSVDWVDPIVGLRVRQDLAGGGEAFVRGDIGGFGAGSEFSWQALGAVNWHVCDHYGIAWDSFIGYRVLSVDYEQGEGTSRYEYDVTEHGPVLGLTGRF